MSVEIYGVETASEKFCTIAVSSERVFNQIWQPAINELNLDLIGNGVWLCRENISDILSEFNQIKEYVKNNKNLLDEDKEYVIKRINYVINNLETNWNKVKTAERLWMG